jgi:hypothetical protein
MIPQYLIVDLTNVEQRGKNMEQSGTDGSSDDDLSSIGDDSKKRFSTKIRRAILGAPRSIKDP